MTGGEGDAPEPGRAAPPQAGQVSDHVHRRFSHLASIATIVGMFITVGGLVFSAGYFVSGVRGDTQIAKLQNSQDRIVALETELKNLRQDLQTAEATNTKQADELSTLNKAIAATETDASTRYDHLRSQLVIQTRRLCSRLDHGSGVQQCLEDIDYLVECSGMKQDALELSACETWPERQRRMARPQ